MATKRQSVKKTPSPGICLNIPKDVQDILLRIVPGEGVLEGIIHLARSYDAIMEEQGQEGQPVVIPQGEESGQSSDLPSIGSITDAMRQMTQPQGSIGEVQVRVHDKSLPRGPDGLVNAEYILASSVPIMQDLLTTDQYIKTYELRFQAIREVLSRVLEDTWNGTNISALVERVYQELVSGRRRIG